MKFHIPKKGYCAYSKSIKYPFTPLSSKFFHLKTKFPQELLDSCFEYYKHQFKLEKISSSQYLNPNPSQHDLKNFNKFLLKSYQDYKSSTGVIQFRNDLIRFFRGNSKLNQEIAQQSNLSSKLSADKHQHLINGFDVLEIDEFIHPDSLRSKERIIHFKALMLISILNNFGLIRSKEDNCEILGLTENRKDLPHHCDQIGGKTNPEYVAIVPVESNSYAYTFFTQNQLLIKEFYKLDPKSFEILNKVIFDFFRINPNQTEFFYKSDKLFRLNQDKSFLIDLSPDKIKISDEGRSNFSRNEINEALKKFKEFCHQLRHSDSTLKLTIQKQSVIFKNSKVLHGRSLIRPEETRDVFYLPFDQSKDLKQINDKEDLEVNSQEGKVSSAISPVNSYPITKHNMIKTFRR